jgi:hypothetical protein
MLYLPFENLVAEVLEKHGYRVHRDMSEVRDQGIDIVATNGLGANIPVQLKMFANQQITLGQLRDACSLASWTRRFARLGRPILVVSGLVNPQHLTWAYTEYGIDIWDRTELRNRAPIGDPLRDKLEKLFAEIDAPPARAEAELPAAVEDKTPEPSAEPRGESLIDRLRAIRPGNKTSKAYEEVCHAIINYVFGDDLKDARSQSRTEDGLNIFDIIFRISPKHPFWVNLTRDFRARVVLFECKNYKEPIGQAQVYMTERYLCSDALRPICFVLSRHQPHAHAMEAASGAMREAGKLFVFLSDDDLVQMIKMKDAQLQAGGGEGNDPTEVLDQKIYDFIASMPR